MKYVLLAIGLCLAVCGTACDVSGPKLSGGRRSLPPNQPRPLTAGEYRDPHSDLWRSAALTETELPQNSDAEIPPTEICELYFNPDGSCVQDSIGEHAAKVNHVNGECLTWNTKYGKAIRGGSTPSRVSAYFAQRGISGWVITKDATWQWMQWAGSTGRGAAVSLDELHFQTVTFYDRRRHVWYVRDNRTPRLIEPYDDETFYAAHVAGGQWTVILNMPAPPPFAQHEVRRVTLGNLSWLSYWFA